MSHVDIIEELDLTQISPRKGKKKKPSLNLGYPMSHVASQKFKKKKKKTFNSTWTLKRTKLTPPPPMPNEY